MRTEDIIPEMFNVSEACKAQARYCEEHEEPHFAPAGGSCWRCSENIYLPISYGKSNEYTAGITVERAGKELITGCPHCNYSFCE